LIELAGAALLMGFAGSLHCVGMCGPFALACGGRSAHVASWQAGKLLTYIVLGGVAGALGGSMPGPVWIVQLLAVGLVLWFGAAALGLLPEPAAIPGLSSGAARLLSKPGLTSRAAFGALNGLLPCGLVYAALGLALAAERPIEGAFVMGAFGLGTSPVVSVFALAAGDLTIGRPRLRKVLAVGASLTGLWVVVRRGGMLPPIH
jgi:sulfite exporter TauE/SafE